MFAPETEDMLPRAAPKPSAAIPVGHSEETVKPAVPELSILFGQTAPVSQPQQLQTIAHQQQQQQQQQSRPISTFASWKKQMLPRVNFSPTLTTDLGPTPTPANLANCMSNSPDYAMPMRGRTYPSEVTPPMHHALINSNGHVEHFGHTHGEAYAHRRSLDSVSQTPRSTAASNVDILTICAGTQTEAISPMTSAFPDISNLVRKEDITPIFNLLEIMRQEQQILRNLCESLLNQKQEQIRPIYPRTLREVATQCEILLPTNSNAPKRFTPIIQDYIVEEDERETVPPQDAYIPMRPLPQFQSPRATPPKAQSTAYRANTTQAGAVLPKPSTEKSLVMNELALKYLPQQQLNELMQELHLKPTQNEKGHIDLPSVNVAPLRQIDNLTQSPNDISNASYKYLKKYRLLSEEQLAQETQQHKGNHQSPMALRQQQQHQQHRPGSPLIAANVRSPQHPMLDLEHLRNQPKLL